MEEGTYWVLGVFGIISIICFVLFINPILQPWWAEQTGKAELAQAEQNRQIAVKEAQAKADAAILLAQAEVSRAEGVAKANKIIGDSLKGNEDYLRYLYINGITENGAQNREIVYIPTEAGIPILEAGKLNK